MDTKTLVQITRTRLSSGDNNPTRKTYLNAVLRALERLYEYETGKYGSQQCEKSDQKA